MSGGYATAFDSVLPYCIELPLDRAKELIAELVEAEGNYTSGSSFAVTSESEHPDYRVIYVSRASYYRLRASGWMTDPGGPIADIQ